MKREGGIELYRVLLMFAIVLLHAAGKGDVRASWLVNLLKFSVTGFVFISGYFGIKFSWWKLGSLYATAAFCAITTELVRYVQIGDIGGVESSFMTLKGYWFLHAYAILMLFSPILNLAAMSKEYRPSVVPALFLVFGWSYCFEIGHLKAFVFPAPGLGAHTPLTLIGIYLLARLFRIENIESWITTKWVVWACLICLPFAVIGLAPYNSIFAVVLAGGGFVLFRRGIRHAQWACYIAPSMFSIYLLHCTGPGLELMRSGGNFLVAVGSPKYGMFLIVAICTFLICLVIDLLRRLALEGINRFRHD